MSKKTAPKRKNPRDSTDRNNRASLKRDTALGVRVDALEARVKATEDRLKLIEPPPEPPV